MALNYEKIMAFRPPERTVTYSPRDCVLYALAIGIGMDPVDAGQLKFVDARKLEAFPTMASVLGWIGRMTDPSFGIDERMVVLADQKVVLHRPLATGAKLTSRARIKEVVDKGPGNHAIVQVTRDLIDADATVVATIDGSALARKHGGFGGPVTTVAEPTPIPDRAPDAVCDLATPPNLALLFALTGDDNPLHLDPERAKVAGFPRPILHGMASFGVAAHAILKTEADYRAERLASIEARFMRPVFPGETIRTEMWRTPAGIVFQCRTVERGEVSVTNGLATLR